MKRYLTLLVFLVMVLASVPSYAFVDWLFGGSSTRGAIGNSVVGDLRGWWTGNPVYYFNPYYSGSQPPAQGSQAAPPTVQYAPGQGSSAYAPQGGYNQYQQPAATYPAPQQGGYVQYQQPSTGYYQAQAAPNYGQTYPQPGYSPALPAGQPYPGTGYSGYSAARPR
jgi:hypothetical protein